MPRLATVLDAGTQAVASAECGAGWFQATDGTLASGAGDAASPSAGNESNPTNTSTRARIIWVRQSCKCAAVIHRWRRWLIGVEGTNLGDFRRGRKPPRQILCTVFSKAGWYPAGGCV